MSSGDGSEYRRVLHEWASKYVPADGTVTDVKIEWDDGYDPTYGENSPTIETTVHWVDEDGDPRTSYIDRDDVGTLGEVLTALFTIAERDDVVQHSTTRPSGER